MLLLVELLEDELFDSVDNAIWPQNSQDQQDLKGTRIFEKGNFLKLWLFHVIPLFEGLLVLLQDAVKLIEELACLNQLLNVFPATFGQPLEWLLLLHLVEGSVAF